MNDKDEQEINWEEADLDDRIRFELKEKTETVTEYKIFIDGKEDGYLFRLGNSYRWQVDCPLIGIFDEKIFADTDEEAMIQVRLKQGTWILDEAFNKGIETEVEFGR